jgi:hypothetical protein
MADLLGTSITSGASDEDLIVEICRPQKRYLRVVVTRGVSTTCESIWAILYGKESSPAEASVPGTSVAALHSSPAEGTP